MDNVAHPDDAAGPMRGAVPDDAASAERLAAFEAFASGVRADLANTSERMDVLRAEGKVKTATYRQLFAVRGTLREIDRRLKDHGL